MVQDSHSTLPVNSHSHSPYQHDLEIGKNPVLFMYHQIAFHPSHSSKYFSSATDFSLRKQIYHI